MSKIFFGSKACRKATTILVGFFLLFSTVSPNLLIPAVVQAADPAPVCGESLTANTALDADMSCSDTALIIGADNIELDCQGRTITYAQAGNHYTQGVYIGSHNNATIKNCNIVQGSTSTFGVGVLVESSSSNNQIINNSITTNGPMSRAVLLRFSSNANTVSDNTIVTTDNSNITANGVNISENSVGNIITNNTINTMNSGVVILDGCANNLVESNSITIEGDNNTSGITIMSAADNQIRSNTITTSKNGVPGIGSHGSNSVFDGNNIITYGNGSHGIAINASTTLENITIANNTIETRGDSSFNIVILNSQNSLIADNILKVYGQGPNTTGLLVGMYTNNITAQLNNITNFGAASTTTDGTNRPASIIVVGQDGNKIINNTITLAATATSNRGILMANNGQTGSNPINTIIEDNAINSAAGYSTGLLISNCQTNIAKDNQITMTGSMSSGVVIANAATNNSIVNNLLSAPTPVYFSSATTTNYWQTDKTLGINIVGGPYLGGNYYATPSGTGWSQVCPDSDSDGICDSPYTVGVNNVDNFPLSIASVYSYCGDGTVDADEECDDSNTVDGDGCSATCTDETQTCAEGMISYWQAEGDVNDSVGTNNGTLINGATFAPGKVGQAFSFDGVDDVVTGPHSSSFPTSAHTISAWVYMTSDAKGTVFSKSIWGAPWADNAYILATNVEIGKVRPHVAVGSNIYWLDSATNLSLNTWYNLVQVHDGNYLRLFINGVEDANSPVSAPGAANDASTAPFNIGATPDADGIVKDAFNGAIDEVAIYNKALSATEVLANYQAGLSGNSYCEAVIPVCGDNTVDTGEECDDGNVVDGDGCSATCTVEPTSVCGNGVVESGEECDDSNAVDGDGCSAVCAIEVPVCGNGVVESGEECDDGNVENGDGCSATCKAEVSTQGFIDNFSSTTLDPAWTIIDNYPGHGYYSLTAQPGALRYYIQPWSIPGDNIHGPDQWNYTYYPAMKMKRAFSGTDWTFETKATYYLPWANGRDLITRVCFGGNTNCASFDIHADLCPGYMNWGSTLDGIPQSGPVPSSGTDVNDYYFRIVRQDRQLSMLWSADGQNWSTLYNTTLSDLNANISQYVLLEGQSWAIPAGSYAAYDYIKVTDGTSTQPVCGNGIMESDEACDDGNVVAGDGCSATCTIETFSCSDGMVAYWQAEGNANDSVGSSDGVLINGATFTSGKVGQAFSFDGNPSHEYVSIGNREGFPTGNSPFTFEAWINPTDIGNANWQAIFMYGNINDCWSNNPEGVGIVISPGTSKLSMVWHCTHGQTDGQTTLVNGNWYHVVGTYDGALVKVYVNGNLENTVSYSGSNLVNNWAYISDSGELIPIREFFGAIDEVAIYNRALPAAEISQHYQNGLIGLDYCGEIPPACGDGTVDSGEECDDGNVVDGDGCSAACTVETPACADGLAAYWKFDENTGSIAHDFINGNDGTIYGADWATGKVGPGLDFNGVDDMIVVPHSPSLSLENYTLEAWVKKRQNPNPEIWNEVILTKKYTGSWMDNYGMYRLNNRFAASSYSPDTWNWFGISSPAELAYNEWDHLVVTYDRNSFKLYINGELDSSQSFSYMPYQNDFPLVIGRGCNGDPCMFDSHYPSIDGVLDEIALYNRALTATEITQHYQNGLSGLGYCGEVPPACGDNTVDTGEDCDDGNVLDGDGCSSSCLTEYCGDGILQTGLNEECDDGNTTDGDGCDSSCALEGVEKIIFSKQEASGNYDLWMMNPDGTGLARLTDEAKNGLNSINPTLFPDGKKILFSRNFNIYILDIDTLQTTALTTDGALGSYSYSVPHLSPDGSKIAYEYGLQVAGSCSACQTFEIWMMDVDGTNKIRMTNNSYRDTDAFFSPDGTKLLITHYQGAPAGDCCNATDVYIMDIATKAETKLYGTSAYNWGSDWSDAGILIRSNDPNYVISRIQPDGTGLTTIFDASKQAVNAVYSPDNTQLAYLSSISGNYNLYVSATDGTNPVQITAGMSLYYYLDWGRVNVSDTNHAPELNLIGNQIVDESQTLFFTVSATDPDSDALTYSAENLPVGATFDPVTKVFSWTPDANQAGSYEVNFVVADDGDPVMNDSETITITVNDTDYCGNGMCTGAETCGNCSQDCGECAKTHVWSDTYFFDNFDRPDGELIPDADPYKYGLSMFPQEDVNYNGGHLVMPIQTGSGESNNSIIVPVKQFLSGDNIKVSWDSSSFASGNQFAYVGAIIHPLSNWGKAATSTYVWFMGGTRYGVGLINQTHADGFAATSSYKISGVDNNHWTAYVLNATKTNPIVRFETPGGVIEQPLDDSIDLSQGFFIAMVAWNNNSSNPDVPAIDNLEMAVTQIPPVLTPIGNQIVDENQTLAFTVLATDPLGETVTYSADNLPAGATLDPNTGEFSWTPDYMQAGDYTTTFTATDNGVPAASTSETITITVNNTNQPPDFYPIGDKVVAENQTLSFILTATDPDFDALAYSADNLPAGATFDSTTGEFSWTPDYTQAGDYTVTFSVVDNGSPAISIYQIINITVNNVNRSPVLVPIGDKAVDENQYLLFTVSANDPDGNTILYSVDNLPTGATFDSVTGEFSWTPDYVQSGDYSVTFTATDDDVSAISVSETITITVNNVNRAPILFSIGDKAVAETQNLSFIVAANDPDGGVITYSATNLPDGATLNPVNGEFSWTPNYTQAGSYQVTFTVTDNGDPAASVSETITITVNNTDYCGDDVCGGAETCGNCLSDCGKCSATHIWSDTYFFDNFNRPDGDLIPDNDPYMYGLTMFPKEGVNYSGGRLVMPIQTGPGESNSSIIVPAKQFLSGDNIKVSWDSSSFSNGDRFAYVGAMIHPISNVGKAATTTYVYFMGSTDIGVGLINQVAANGYSYNSSNTVSMVDNNHWTAYVLNATKANPTVRFETPGGVIERPLDSSIDLSQGFFIVMLAWYNNSTNPDTPAIDNWEMNVTEIPPVLSPLANKSVDEGQALSFTISATDPDNGTVTYSAANLPAGATLDPATGEFSWTPDYTQSGDHSVTFIATDDGVPASSASETIIITVNNINRAPVFNLIGDKVADENQNLSFTVSATDPDGDEITYAVNNLPTGASFDPVTRIFTWTPNYSQAGDYTITFAATDNGDPAISVSEIITVTVNNINRAPVLNSIGDKSVDEGQNLSFVVSAVDPDGDDITYSASNLPTGASFDPETRGFAWDPDYTQAGSYNVTFTVTDNGSPVASVSETIVITVNDITPAELADQTVEEVYSLDLPTGTENSFMANLRNVDKFIDKGMNSQAITQLEVFISKVNVAIANNTITVIDGNNLIAMANDLINMLR